MEKIVVANHKMNLDLNEIKDFISKTKGKQVIVCPTSIYTSYFIDGGIVTGLQNIYHEDFGAYTGEISPKQAKSLGIDYAIIGHSERRTVFKEDNNIINKKIKKALENGLKVIFCIGEKLNEDYKVVLENQITEGLNNIQEEIIVAYEPVWSIGTGKIPTNEDIIKVTNYIKEFFSYEVKVLYGGSVNTSNINTLNEVKEVSGYLIGGASTNADELIKIIEVVS